VKKILALALLCITQFAYADAVTIETRFGALKTNKDGALVHKGKVVLPEVSLPSSAYVLGTYKLGTSDVVFVSQFGGSACPGAFAYVTVTADGAKATPQFGTCYDDDVKPVQIGETIAFSMKGLKGKGTSRYVYERGVVFENGKPVK